MLGELCGALVVSSGAGGFTQSDAAPSAWRRLTEVPAGAIESAMGRSGVQLEGGEATGILDRLYAHFARAQRRRERSG
jgi:hypothetical protein